MRPYLPNLDHGSNQNALPGNGDRLLISMECKNPKEGGDRFSAICCSLAPQGATNLRLKTGLTELALIRRHYAVTLP